MLTLHCLHCSSIAQMKLYLVEYCASLNVLPSTLCAKKWDIFIQSTVRHFPKFKMAAAAILDFQVMWIWPFRRVDIVWYLCSVPNLVQISVSHWDRCTYASDLHLMTSRKLTSGFDFLSRGHLRMVVVHLPMKFGADIFVQSGVDIFFQN